LAILGFGTVAAATLRWILVGLAKLFISATLAGSLTFAHEFLDDDERLDAATDDMFACQLDLSHSEEACQRTETYRAFFGDSPFPLVEATGNPVVYLAAYVGAGAAVLVIVLLKRRETVPRE
jgi:hypothetical protein